MSTKAGRAYSSPKNINLKGQGTGRGGILRFEGTNSSNPLGTTANGLYINSSNELVFVAQGTSTTLGGVGSSVSLDSAYGDGKTITIDDGAIILNDATAAAANTMEFNKTGAGSGNILDFDFTAAFTGNVLNLDMGSAVAAVGIVIDSEAQARTGSDIVFTDNSTGTHSNLEINKSGAGASTGIAYTNSYAGSPGGNAISLTFDDNDGLSTGGILITRGAGVRTDNAIAIAEGSTGNVDIIDVNVTGVYTGDVFDINFSAAATGNGIDITTGSNLAGNAIRIVTANERTAPVVLITSAGTDGGTDDHLFDVNVSGLLNSNVLDITYSVAASDGNAVYVDMATNLAGGALVVAATGTRTDSLLDVVSGDDGSTDGGILYAEETAVFTGSMITLKTSAAATTGSMLHFDLDSGVAYKAITFDHAGARTVATILATFDGTFGATGGGTFLDANISMTGALASPFIDIDVSGVYTGNIFDVALGAASTGDVISIDMNAGVAASAIVLDAGNAARTDDLIKITDDGSGNVDAFAITAANTGSGSVIDLDVTGIRTGNIIDIAMSGAATSTAVIAIDLDAAVAATALLLDAGNAARTADIIDVTFDGSGNVAFLDLNVTNTGSGDLFDIDVTGVHTGDVFDVGLGAADTGNVLNIDMNLGVAATAIRIDAGGGLRTQPLMETIFDGTGDTIGGTLWDIDVTNTGATASPLFDIDITAVYTGNIFDVVFGNASASTGDAFHADMGTNLAGNAIQIDAAGTRTAPLVYIANTGADGGTDDHVLFINQTGLLDSNLVQLTFGTAASTGDALSIAMDTDVAGRAIYVSSAGTGVSGEGVVFDVAHTGALVAGADAVRILSTGSPSSTSNVLAVEQTTGAGSAGAYAVYINATGDNVEALKVDAGNVVFDENLTVTGTSTLTGAATATLGLQTTATARTVTADGLTTGIIAAGTGVVTVTSDDATKILTLPTAVVGNTIWVFAPATGFEVRTPAASGATINNVDSDGTNEAAIPANSTSLFVCTGTDEWILMNWTNLGAVTTAIVPDAA